MARPMTAARRAFLLVTGIAFCAAGAGCHTMSNAAQGTVVGGGLGALTGAIVGHQLGHRDAGALLGAAAGGLSGAVVGREMDVREERDASVRYAQHLEQAIVADSKRLTNYDLARLTASGASDDVIIAAVRSHGGNFDLTPDGLIQLKALGVSDRVILAVQQYASAPPALTAVPGQGETPRWGPTSKPKRRPWWRRVETHDGRHVESRWW